MSDGMRCNRCGAGAAIGDTLQHRPWCGTPARPWSEMTDEDFGRLLRAVCASMGVRALCSAEAFRRALERCLDRKMPFAAHWDEALRPTSDPGVVWQAAVETVREMVVRREPNRLGEICDECDAVTPVGSSRVFHAVSCSRSPLNTRPATDSRTIADIAGELKRRQATALDEGCAALLRAGVDVRDIEIVHETYSRSEDPLVIHSRAYVRVRRGPSL